MILASASPRRKELLEAAGFSFEVIPASVDETRFGNEPAEELVSRVAAEKAEAILRRLPAGSNAVVLGADTVVVVDSQAESLAESTTLGKPASAEDAKRILRLLSGRQHRVLTGVCLMRYGDNGNEQRLKKDVQICSTTVWFSPLSDAEINDYVATGEPFDKAGAYAIQGRASRFVEKIDGCYFNVVGLPVSLVYRMLNAIGC